MNGGDLQRLWARVEERFTGPRGSVHGPAHWRRVERNGRVLARSSGADLLVVRLFALFHDSQRVNDERDDGHGARGARLAASLRGIEYELDDPRFALLHEACADHTGGRTHPDPTIGTCWDADRLDLGREGVWIEPSPAYMSTDLARDLAARGDLERRLTALHESTRES